MNDNDARGSADVEGPWPEAPHAIAYEGKRLTLLDEASSIVNGQRAVDYGQSRLESFGAIARGWSIVLGMEVTPEQVVLCMIQLKVARAVGGGFHRDSFVDIAGYAQCMEIIADERAAREAS